MSDFTFQNKRFSVQPDLSLADLAYRKTRKIIRWLFIVSLIFIGLFGIQKLFSANLKVFLASLLADMILFYLWRTRKEQAAEISFQQISEAEPEEAIEISLFFNKAVKQTLKDAQAYCYKHKHRFIRPIHIFAFALENKKFEKVFKRLNCSFDDVIKKTNNILSKAVLGGLESSEQGSARKGLMLSSDLEEVFFDTYLFALQEEKKQIGLLDFIWASSRRNNLIKMIFDEFGINSDEIAKVARWFVLEEFIKEQERLFFWRRIFKPKGSLNRAMTAASTPLLDKVSQDLTLMARQGRFEMILGREKEIADIFNLFASGQAGVVLVGSGEVGKKSILKKIAQMMVQEDIPKFLQDKRLVKLNLGSLVGLTGARQRGEEFFKTVIAEVNRAGNIVLVIENIDNLVGLRTQEGGLDFATLLTSALDSQAFYLLATATSKGFSEKIEGQALDQVLSKVKIDLPSRDLLWRILIAKVFILEKDLDILFSADAIDEAINLADRYFYGQALSVRAMELLKETAFLVRSMRGKESLVVSKDVVDLAARKIDVPVGEVQESEKEKLLHLEDLIHQRLIDQEEAVKAVADAMRRNRLYLRESKKPICNFLFVGPTGVGKTELAKTLARVYFGDEKRMVRFDMSEYQEKRAIRRLIGSRTEEGNYKGYLTETIKRQPYSLLLFDEIEKAHPDILNLFLQMMDDGRLTDASGETINFSNTIIISTSNAGTQFVQEQIKQGVDYATIDRQLKERVLLEFFRPEFLNRFDRVVLFKSLTMGDLIAITEIFLNDVRAKLEDKGVYLEVDDDAIRELAQHGFDPLYGARPLKRVIQERIENVVARLFLEDRLKRRDKLIFRKGLIFEIKKAAEF